MADYWKSLDKKFCDYCKCWMTDNKSSIAFHENGNRHKMNVQKRLREIHKKNKQETKSESKLQRELRKIEQAAAAAAEKDIEENPDVSMKIQTIYNELKKDGEIPCEGEGTSNEEKSSGPKILHRNDKKKKQDEAALARLNEPVRDYKRLGSWESPKSKSIGRDYLELPTKAAMSAGTSLQLSAMAEADDPIEFGEKQADSSDIGYNTGSSNVAFKKRKLNKGNMRKKEED